MLVLTLVFSMTACGGTQNRSGEIDIKDNYRHKAIINDAIEELKSEWERIYDDSVADTDGYFEIKNTRLIEIGNNDTEELKDIDYLVEFVLYTDYLGSAPYYSSVGLSDTVIVYKDGTMTVPSKNSLRAYSQRHYSYDYSDIIKDIFDYGSKYNCTEYLK